MAAQWVHLGDAGVLVATDSGAWLVRQELGTWGLMTPMSASRPGTRAATAHLLDGAIAAAERAAPRRSPVPMTAARWVGHLVSQWHCAHHSVSLLPAVIARFVGAGREELARFARRKLAEERGHDQFPLSDLRALGYDAEAAVAALAPSVAVSAGLDYARETILGEHPVEFLGYVYAIERRVIRIPEAWFSDLSGVLGPGVVAATGLRAHATALDHRHVEEAVSCIAALPAADRARIALGCHRTTQIRCASGPDEEPDPEALTLTLSRSRTAQASARSGSPPTPGG